MLTPAIRFTAILTKKTACLTFSAVLILALQGCSSYGTASRGDLDKWESDMEYSAVDNKYYHRSKPPSVQEVIFAEHLREAREG